MNADVVVVHGMLNPDGTLQVAEKLALPPGPVEVTVKALKQAEGQDYWSVLKRIWAEQQASDHVPRTRDEIDAELQAMREEWEERQNALERLAEEAGGQDTVAGPQG